MSDHEGDPVPYNLEADPGVHLTATQAWELWYFLERPDVPPWWEQELPLQEIHELLKDWIRSDAGFGHSDTYEPQPDA